jgi:hypothetical protein
VRPSRLILAAIALAAAPGVRAGETSYSITETLVGEWHWDNGNGFPVREDGTATGNPSDDYFGAIKNRLNIGITAPGIDVGLRVDTSTYRFLMPGWMGDDNDVQRTERERLWYLRHDVTQDADGGYGHVGDYRLERAYAAIELGADWRLTAGDFNVQIGRGLALSLRKLDELGIDNALRGIRIDGRVVDRVDLSLMSGLVNVTNVDDRFNLIAEDPLDRVSAARVAVGLWSFNRASLHTVFLQSRAEDAVSPDTVVYGGTLEFDDLPWGLRFYAEANGIRRSLVGGEAENGFAIFADLSATFGPVTLGLEYKDYEDFTVRGSGTDAGGVAWEYNRPPMADLDDQLIEVFDDVRGGRIRGEVVVYDGIAILFGFAGADDLNEGEYDANHDAVHGYGGFDLSFADGRYTVRGIAGYRHAWETFAGETQAYRTLVHLKLEAHLHLWGPLSLGASVLHEEWSQRDIEDMIDFRRGTTALSLDWAGVGGIFGTFEYDTQVDREGFDNYFYAGGIQWFALDWLTVRARGGSQRGGKKCVAGVCRDYPPMAGARLEVVFRL